MEQLEGIERVSMDMSDKQQARFQRLRTSTLKTVRAWAIKDMALPVATICAPHMGA